MLGFIKKMNRAESRKRRTREAAKRESRRYEVSTDEGAARKLARWIRLMFVLLFMVIVVSVRLTDIRVIGNKTYTEEQVTEMVFPGVWDRNTLWCIVREHVQKHKQLPFIEDYDIQLTGPFSCDLVIYEKSIVGYLEYMSSYMYFDKDGVIVESSQEKLDGIPCITGLSFGHIVLNQALPVKDSSLFDLIMNLTQQLKYYGIESSRIDFDALRNVTVTIEDGDIEVKLGTDKGMDAKLSVLNDMLPKLREQGLKGVLDLSNYDDNEKGQATTFHIRKDEPEANGAGDASGAMTGENEAEEAVDR